jgi:hypothetical protein
MKNFSENDTGCDNLLCEQLDLFSDRQESIEV